MQDSKGRGPAEDKKRAERKSEATSDQTLSDLEEAAKDSGSATPARDPGPAPDGALDESDEIKDVGPM